MSQPDKEIEWSVFLNDNFAWRHVVALMALVCVLLPLIKYHLVSHDGNGDGGPDIATDALLVCKTK